MKGKTEKNRGITFGRPPDSLAGLIKLDRYLQIMPAFWDNPLQELSGGEVLNRLRQKDELSLSKSTLYEYIGVLVRDGRLKRTKEGKYKLANPPNLIDKNTPAYYIKNKEFSGFFPSLISTHECMHYYGFKETDQDKKNGLELSLLPELKKLGRNIGEAIKDFYESTGKKPRVVAYTNYGPHPSGQASYVFGELQNKVYSFINKNKNEISYEKMQTALNKTMTKILRESVVEYLIVIRDQLADKHKEILSLKGDTERIRAYLYETNKDKTDYIKQRTDKQLIESVNSFLKELEQGINYTKRTTDEMKKAHPFDILNLASYGFIFSKEKLDNLISKEAKSIYQSICAKVNNLQY